MSAPTPDRPRRAGRPSTATHPCITVAHIDTGAMVTWNDGVFVGDHEMAETARRAAEAGIPVDTGPQYGTVVADADTPAGALAAMLSSAPGRSILVAPLDQPIPGWPEPRVCVHNDLTLVVG